ncbi:RNase P modulator RnpM [Anaerosinus massiliensis]|uniref:RNase P modulator RnpM n=1 Tax=Massilibacillus massiliensis TaxID=1806837 RepID=UPI000B141C93|nr:YlxR family protein [Massilibacillus massiliensis]
MATQKKIPQRMCVGCKEMRNKRDLVRVVRTPEGEFLIDHTGKKSGRGAYVCRNTECFAKAFKEKQFEKSFKSVLNSKIYDELRAQVFSDE